MKLPNLNMQMKHRILQQSIPIRPRILWISCKKMLAARLEPILLINLVIVLFFCS